MTSNDSVTIRGIELPNGSLLIGDGRVARTDAGVFEQIDPSTGEVLAPVTLAGATEIDAAVRAANDAEAGWRALAPTRRRKGLNMAVEYIRYFAGWVDKLEGTTIPISSTVLDYTIPEPYGTVAALTPWNGGVVSVAMKVVPALVAGNCVVLKPSELATLAPLRFGELALEAGIPPGVLNVVPGGVAAGEALVAHAGVDKISFTGGTATARHVLRGAAANVMPWVAAAMFLGWEATWHLGSLLHRQFSAASTIRRRSRKTRCSDQCSASCSSATKTKPFDLRTIRSMVSADSSSHATSAGRIGSRTG